MSDDDDDAKREYYGMYMFVYVATKSTNFWDTSLHNIIEVINFIFKFSILTWHDDR